MLERKIIVIKIVMIIGFIILLGSVGARIVQYNLGNTIINVPDYFIIVSYFLFGIAFTLISDNFDNLHHFNKTTESVVHKKKSRIYLGRKNSSSQATSIGIIFIGILAVYSFFKKNDERTTEAGVQSDLLGIIFFFASFLFLTKSSLDESNQLVLSYFCVTLIMVLFSVVCQYTQFFFGHRKYQIVIVANYIIALAYFIVGIYLVLQVQYNSNLVLNIIILKSAMVIYMILLFGFYTWSISKYMLVIDSRSDSISYYRIKDEKKEKLRLKIYIVSFVLVSIIWILQSDVINTRQMMLSKSENHEFYKKVDNTLERVELSDEQLITLIEVISNRYPEIDSSANYFFQYRLVFEVGNQIKVIDFVEQKYETIMSISSSKMKEGRMNLLNTKSYVIDKETTMVLKRSHVLDYTY